MINPLSITFVLVIVVTLSSIQASSKTKQIEVICTSNKNQTGDCRKINDDDDSNDQLKASTCTQVSSNLIECSSEDLKSKSNYNCIKSLSISTHQQLFTCQKNALSTQIENSQFDPDEINSDLLNSTSYDEGEISSDSNEIIKSGSETNPYMDAIIINPKGLQNGETIDEIKTRNSFTYGY